MLYNDCNECPRNNTKECPFGHWSQRMRSNICQFLRLPINPFHEPIKWFPLPPDYSPRIEENEYSYSEFHHFAFDAKTPENQARQFQDVLVSTAAICDFRKLDITKYKFFVNSEGQARAEMPV